MKAINHLLSELFRLHHRELLRFTTRLVGNRDDGEEIAQDAYMKMARRDGEATIDFPKAYLFTAARNAAIDFTARRNREWSCRVDVEDMDEQAAQTDLHAGMEQRQQLAALVIALNELPTVCRETFILNKIEGRSHQEIARKFGISISMVEKHIIRALRHCRDLRRQDGSF